MEAVVKSGMAHSLHHLHADERDDDGAAEDEGKARIPGAEDVEEALDASRVQHSGEGQAKAEDDAGGESGSELVDVPVHSPKPRRTVTATAPEVRNVATATIDRGDRRARPRTPWPLVQPDPMREPKPTSRPAVTISGHPTVISTVGQPSKIDR